MSQFTLLADSGRQKGTRPGFSDAARPEVGARRAEGVHVQTGIFGAYMQVELVNDGPVTIVLDVG